MSQLDIKNCKELKIKFLEYLVICNEKDINKFMSETMSTIFKALIRKETNTKKSNSLWSIFFLKRSPKIIKAFMNFDLGRLLFFNNIKNIIEKIRPRILFFYNLIREHENDNISENLKSIDFIMSVMYYHSLNEPMLSLNWISVFSPLLENYEFLSKEEQDFLFNSVFYRNGDIVPLVKIGKGIDKIKSETKNNIFTSNILNFFQNGGNIDIDSYISAKDFNDYVIHQIVKN